MIIAHFGYPWYGEVLALLRKRPNVFTDVSVLGGRPWFLYNALVGAMEYHATDKILFRLRLPIFLDAGNGRGASARAGHQPWYGHAPDTGDAHRGDYRARFIGADRHRIVGFTHANKKAGRRKALLRPASRVREKSVTPDYSSSTIASMI